MEQNSFLKAKDWGILAFGFFSGFFIYGLLVITTIFSENKDINIACGLLIIVSLICFLIFGFKSLGLIQSQTNAPVKTFFKRVVLITIFCAIILLGFIVVNANTIASKNIILLAEFKKNLGFLVLILLIPILYALYLFLHIYYILYKISGEKLFLVYVYYQAISFFIGFLSGLAGIKIPALIETIISFLSVCIAYAAWKSVDKFEKIEQNFTRL